MGVTIALSYGKRREQGVFSVYWEDSEPGLVHCIALPAHYDSHDDG